ncbi:NADH-dependent flavin oxidoreductase [Holzapfeliella sp. He02]|uniref:NADH-dependent flavin oxidoreductase n=1 Tax=Holzapfeliella saturejae TaxID=3082953 RepID=A0ABU8SI01_9LACO
MLDVLKDFEFKKGVHLKNKLVMAPMTTWSSNDDYTVADQELNYYDKRSYGPGMIITGCAHIQPNGIGFTNEYSIDDDEFLPGLTQLATTVKKHGAKAIIQINHAGNKALPQVEDLVSASNIAVSRNPEAPIPRALSEDEINEVIKDFGKATKRAIEAGFDGIELHGAHGFLLQNFMSTHFNHRTDQWGGTLENRMRFPLEVVKEVQRVIAQYASKEFILGYRFSPEEHYEDGLTLEDNYALIDELINLDIDYVHASLVNALESKSRDYHDSYLNLLTHHIDNRIKLLVAGQISTIDSAENIWKSGAIPAIGHAFVTDPNWIQQTIQDNRYQVNLTINPNDLSDLRLPDKLWHEIQSAPGWFDVKS